MCPAGTVRCQVGAEHQSGLCAACGDFGQACCSAPRTCDFGVCGGGHCVKEPDISGAWASNLRFTYQINQQAGSFTWTVSSPSHVQEQGSGTIAFDDASTSWKVRATWSGNNGSGTAIGTIAEFGRDNRAVRITWDNGVVFVRGFR